MSPSRPYKSRLIRAVVRQTRYWLDRGQVAVRQAQIVANWSAQILLYPVYALFQSGRLLGRTIDQTVHLRSPQFAQAAPPDEIPLEPAIAQLTPDTPILNLLQTISTLVTTKVVVWTGQSNVSIRAIACLLEPRSLVLVTNQNQTLNVLTPEQQHWLQQRLIYEIASFDRLRRIENLPQQRLNRLLQTVRSRLLAPLRSLHSSSRLPPDSLSIDRPVQRSMLHLRQLLTAPDSPALQISHPTSLSSPAFTQLPPTYIRGVAALLATRSLVLVTNHNELLDILTPDQQTLLQQRLTWEVAHYRRYLRLCRQTLLPPLRPPSEHNRMLPVVSAFRWLMTWMQFGYVARSTNLFQEATLLACPLPAPKTAIAAASSTSTPIPQPQLNPVSASLSPVQRLTTLRRLEPVRLATPRSQPSVHRDSALTIAESTVVTATLPVQSAIAPQLEPENNEKRPSYINAPATVIGYEQSWLDRTIHWLDRCFVWLETLINSVWSMVTRRKN